MKTICNDLRREYDLLDDLVSSLDSGQWQKITPFYKWTIYDEIAHICFFDTTALMAVTDREEFKKHVSEIAVKFMKSERFPDIVDGHFGVMEPAGILAKWRAVRNELLVKLGAMGAKDRLPWYGPDMSALSFATARYMETWAHGQDIYDTLQVKRENSDSIKNIAHLGVSTFKWTFVNRKLNPPGELPRVELLSPSGEAWKWGDVNAGSLIKGSAEDFSLVVTQRRNVDDTNLEVAGEPAKQWMSIAQCFAGPPADGPAPGERNIIY